MTVHFTDFGRVKHTGNLQLSDEDSHARSLAAVPGVYRKIGKRLCDLAFVICVAPLALLIVAIAALATARDGHNPFYTQKRVGRNGRVFRLLKIRSMVPDAEAQLEAFLQENPAARLEWDEKQKLEHDPRITRVGSFLRRSSLDELPQLWNVFRGDMSVVGPRPMMLDQRALYPGTAYYNLRPGITGPWQVSDRNECSFAARAKFDSAYDAGLSFRSDLQILLRTVAVVLKCTGR